ncbi:single-stranded DNA-binding protein [Specibacter sp. NPDC057265]|uniref:single-stranded DNA-binding protein n=1 Tax=Specibacter sp. NPDC057265 TaxID=3346075 RepID=UPI0036270A95
MSNYVTIQGFASSDVELDTKESGLVVGKFRMGSTHRMQDPITRLWVDGETNWYRVNMFRALAHNVAASVKKGDRIIVIGRLRIKTWLKPDGSPGMGVEIDAETVANDLKFGTCTYHRGAGRTGAANGTSHGTTTSAMDSAGATDPAAGAAAGVWAGTEAPTPTTGGSSPTAGEGELDVAEPEVDEADADGDGLEAEGEMNVNRSTGELLDATPPPY